MSADTILHLLEGGFVLGLLLFATTIVIRIFRKTP